MDLAGVFGALRADSKVCWLSNLSRYATLVVWDLEDPRQRLRLPPGRAGVPIPFELARVGVVGAGDAGFLTIFGPEPGDAGSGPQARTCSGDLQPPSLDPSATYYAVLKVLSDAWADPGQERLPSSAEVASTLRGKGLAITSRAVDHHIDYLIRRSRLDNSRHGGGQRWRREALVQMCVVQGWLSP